MENTVVKRKARNGARKGMPSPRKGIPNKATQNAREAIARFVDANAPRLHGWLEEIAERDGPMAAFKCLESVIEYHVPKLARHEHTGEGGGAIVIQASTTDEKL